MYSHTGGVDGCDEGFVFFVGDQSCSMPACTPIKHVEMMFFRMNKRSHSTCKLKVSGNYVLHALLGPGLAHSRQTRQVCTTSGIKSRTFCETPTLSRNLFMVCSEACHHLVCNFLRDRRIAPSRVVRNSLTTLPISKLFQSLVFQDCRLCRDRS